MEPQTVPQLPLGRAAVLLRLGEHLLFLVLVPLAVLRALGGNGDLAAVVGVGASILLWYGLGVSPFALRSSGRELWLVGLVGLTLLALWISPDFAWVSFAVFVALADDLAPRPAVIAVLAVGLGTGGLLVARWPGDSHPAAPLLGPVVGAVVVLVLVGSARLAASEAAQRQRLVEELVEARDRLALVNLSAGARAERERLSREIHDTLAQDLTSIVLISRRTLQVLGTGDLGHVRRELGLMEQVGARGLESARRLVRELPPAELDGSSLVDALETMTTAVPVDGPTVDLRVEGGGSNLDPQVEATLLRIAQEALTNARRHAEATAVVLTLTRLDDVISLDVTDDGIGFDPSEPRRDRFGLAGMRARTEALGGVLTVESDAGEGTTVNATVPVTPGATGREGSA